MAISLFVKISLKPGTRDEFVEIAKAHGGRVREREPGCHHFDVLVQDDSPDQVCLYEIYEDQAALDLHVGTDYMAAYREQTADMTIDRERILSTIIG